MDVIGTGETYYMVVFIIGEDGHGVSGLTIRYKIINCKGGVTHSEGTLIEDKVNPGVYVRGVVFIAASQYRILYFPPDGWKDSLETVHVKVA